MQQSEIAKLLMDDTKFICDLHPENQLQTIFFGDVKEQKSRFLCNECQIESAQELKNFNIFAISIQRFLKQSDLIVDKVLILKNNDQMLIETQIVNKLQSEIDKFEVHVKEQVKMMRQNLSDIQSKTQAAYIRSQVLSEIGLNDINDRLQVVLQMDSHQGTEEFKQLEEKLNIASKYLIQMRNGASNKIDANQRELINKLHQNFSSIQKGLDDVAKNIMEQLFAITTACIPPSIYDEIKDYPQIHQQICEGKKLQYQLLYQGTRDGLNGQTYWAKCNGQSNLLTIMTSKNGQKFGGYSPCTINNGQAAYVQDPSMKSFIFQYNKKEIYKLKLQTHALYCNYASYGPTFGGGHDIYIAVDFNSGYTNLGHSYDISGYNVDIKTHIFGATTPQLQECKVYKVNYTLKQSNYFSCSIFNLFLQLEIYWVFILQISILIILVQNKQLQIDHNILIGICLDLDLDLEVNFNKKKTRSASGIGASLATPYRSLNLDRFCLNGEPHKFHFMRPNQQDDELLLLGLFLIKFNYGFYIYYRYLKFFHFERQASYQSKISHEMQLQICFLRFEIIFFITLIYIYLSQYIFIKCIQQTIYLNILKIVMMQAVIIITIFIEKHKLKISQIISKQGHRQFKKHNYSLILISGVIININIFLQFHPKKKKEISIRNRCFTCNSQQESKLGQVLWILLSPKSLKSEAHLIK
ncbi:hypothetical protein pb186bvf_003098 [Paramecium bursaria]